jgi:ubiquinone/menaquinone biosynthesis C-methylase UbiE
MRKDPKSGALYDGFIADYYDLSPIVVEREQDVAFYCEAAEETGGPVLELGCGTGRVTMAIAERGHRITGLDLSRRMLERAERKREALPKETRKQVQLVHGDMTHFKLREKFRLILMPFRPFQHVLETEQQIACLECARKHLKRGGRLILDFFQTDAQRMHDRKFHEESPVVEYDTPDGRHVRMTERVAAFHRAEQRNDVEMIFYVTDASGHTERLVFAWTLRYFFRYEVEHLLARCGFRVNALYGDFDRSPIRDDSPEMIFVAEAE